MRFQGSSRSGLFVLTTGAMMVTIMAILTVFDVRPAIGEPADIFSSPAPVIGADPQKATDLKAGDASVSTQTGALTYSYPIHVPPGRNGMAAQLALAYSSQAPIYGGIAAGWSLSIPEIREDTSQSRFVSRPRLVGPLGADLRGDDRFVSSLAGGRPLVAVSEPTSPGVYQTYRVQNDGSFARYERMHTDQPFRWRVYTTDGNVMTFGEASRVPNCVNVSDQYAPLTGVVDPFGNEIKYEYSSGPVDMIAGECRISKITWGQNTNPKIAQSFAHVVFGYDVPHSCTSPAIQPGSFRDYHSVEPKHPPIVTGASKLLTITATAYPPGAPGSPVHTRLVTLGYDPNSELCDRSHSPVRLLTSIRESAWGTDSPRVDLPAIRFEYGNPAVALTSNVTQARAPWLNLALPYRNSNLAWGYRRADDRWPSLEAMLLDIDGDGLLDRVTNANSNTDHLHPISSCTANWQRNLGPNASGNIVFSGVTKSIALPRLKWRGTDDAHQVPAGSATAQSDSPSYESCSLNGQVTAYQNSVGASFCHPPTTSGSAPDPADTNTYCFDGGTELPKAGAGMSDFRTYLAYRWLDVDGDGLPDLVAAVHGNINAYDIERGNRLNIGAGGLELNYAGGEPSISGIPAAGHWPACPGQGDRCKDFGDCLKGSMTCPNGVCTTDWNVVNRCLISCASVGCAQIAAKPAPQPHTPTLSRAPYTRCEGLYPWFIYKNQGNGIFATTPIVKYQPVPLESQASDSAMTGPGVTAENHAIVDFDGDGVLDAVVRDDDPANSGVWQVWLGDGTGGFGTTRYVYFTRNGNNGENRIGSQGFAAGPLVSSSAGLFDINGDGLLDHWAPSSSPTSPPHFNVAISDGTQHRLYGVGITPIGEIDTPANVKPGADTNYTVTMYSDTNFPLVGFSNAQNRVVDVDNDGRPDVVSIPPSPVIDVDNDGRPDVVSFPPSPVVYWNGGGQFLATSKAYPGANDNGIRRWTEGWGNLPSAIPDALYWELKGDLTDLDGNGIPESVYFVGTVFNRNKETSQPATTEPPRLITAIHNGRGGHVAVTYASMHDPAGTVVQHPELRWTDAFCPATIACPKATSREQWVVKNLTVTDDFPTTRSITRYVYKNPRHSPDDRGHYAFRGFETVITTAPSLATTEQTYSYNVDWSGRLTRTIGKPSPTESATDVRSIDTTTWTGRSLFGAAIRTYHATMSEHFTCANGQTEATCTPSAAAAYTRTTSTLTALASTTTGGDSPLLWQTTASLLQAGTVTAEGDRHTTMTFALHADGATYRLRPLATTHEQRVSGAMVMYAQSAQTWDPTYRVPLTDEVWVDTSAANRTIARSVYDMTTGNLIQHWKPKQNAAGTTSTTFTYDARKLSVATEINEVEHQRDYVYEYGTGTKLQTDGPNQRSCITGVGCQLDATHPLKEQRTIRVDGLGRMFERSETVSDDGVFYTLYKLETNSYVDEATPVYPATPTVPTSTTNQVRLNVSGSTDADTVWTQQKTELDGHGRPTKTTVYAQGSVPNDQITAFVYRADGTLQSVLVPDPTANNASLVMYTYRFDSLGRATSIRRPDSTNPLVQSGADITYDGVTKTTTEFVGAAGGQPAMTKTINDSFGRLKEVNERTAITPLTFAKTRYTYGPDDEVATITAPQGVITTLTHDFAGRRTKITRHGREWKYTYDANGNAIAEQVPGSTSPLTETDPLFTTTTVYDDLDRPISKAIAPRNLTVDDQALFVSGTETLVWDAGPNGKGYLSNWQAFAPGEVKTRLWTSHSNDNQGHPTGLTHTATIAGYPETARTYSQTWFPFGGVNRKTYNDFVIGTNQTEVDHLYDARGLPSSMQMNTPISQAVAIQTRNVAGLVTQRRTNTTGAMTFVESNWTYDKLGRVTDQTVQKAGPTPVARQTLTYFGNDDPKTLQQYLGATSRAFTYGYDLRHQLTRVTTNKSTYFGATYQYGLGGRFTKANETRTISPTPAGSNLAVRNVKYVYGDADPERVTALTNVSGGTRYATYTYDAAGNQIWKCNGAVYTPICQGESFDYLYDGKDQLRRATRKVNNVVQGSEEYWYDGSGQRMLIVKRDAAGVKKELVWFIVDVEAHYDGAGAVTKVYSHLSMGTPVARVERTRNTTTAIEYQFHGLASSTLAAVDQGGTINASFSYAPFGEVLEATNAGGVDVGTAAHKRRMNDKFEDEVSGLAYYGARYYDRTTMSWTESDPLYRFAPEAASASPRKSNLYTSDLNNPLRYIDPDGRSVCGIFGVMGNIACGIANDDSAGQIAWDTTKDATGISDVENAVGVIERHDPVEIAAIAVVIVATHKIIATAEAYKAAAALRPGSVQAAVARAEAGVGAVLSDGAGATTAEKTASQGGADAGKAVDKATRARVLERDKNPDASHTCWRCGEKLNSPKDVDIGHKNVPRSKGGNLSDVNLACEGKACNRSAGNRGRPSPGKSCGEMNANACPVLPQPHKPNASPLAPTAIDIRHY